MDLSSAVTKGGEVRIRTVISRSSVGLTVSVKTVPEVEDFIRSQSEGEVEVSAFGRYWVPESKEAPPLVAYDYVFPTVRVDGKLFATTNRLGLPLFGGDALATGEQHVNLSFLRLVGISKGITFRLKGVYGFDLLRKVRDQITLAQVALYKEYIRPVDLTTSVIVQASEGELKL